MTNYLNDSVIFSNGATFEMAKIIIRKLGQDLGFREEEILSNLAEVEQNNDVPEGYIQYVFYDKNGEGFQAGKYPNGNYGITL